MRARARETVEKKGAPPLERERERERGALTEAALVPKTALLADLVFEVVLHQAGLRRLDGAREFIDQKAKEHKVERPEAQTAYGNLLVILERGAEEAGERQILSAFLTLGLRAHTSRVVRAERRAAFARLLPQFDWLEANSLPSAYLYADEVLDADDASLLWDAVVEATVKGGPRRADALLRVEALRHARIERRAPRLARIAAESSDTAVVALARSILSTPGADADAAPLGGAAEVKGELFPSHGGPVWRAIAVWTGMVFGRDLGLLLGSLLFGLRRSATAVSTARGLFVRSEVWMIGRLISTRDERIGWPAVARVEREVRFPHLYLIVGVAALALGVFFGTVFLVDGLRTAYWPLIVMGVLGPVGGVTLDLVLFSFYPARRGRCTLRFDLFGHRTLRLVDVDAKAAAALLSDAARRLGTAA